MPPFFRSLQKSFWHTFARVRAHARIRVARAGMRVTRREKSGYENGEGRREKERQKERKGEKDREKGSRRVDLLSTRGRLPASLPACLPTRLHLNRIVDAPAHRISMWLSS